MRPLVLLSLLALCLTAVGCCGTSQPAPSASGVDFEPVVAQPVSGLCLQLPLLPCKVCLGVDCSALPPLLSPAVFGTPVTYSRPAASPCEPVYAAPDPCSGSTSDCGYGMPPTASVYEQPPRDAGPLCPDCVVE